MASTVSGVLARLALPLALLGGAYFLARHAGSLPSSLAGLTAYGPYFVLALGIGLAIGFGRGRAVFALLTLTLALIAFPLWLQHGFDSLAARGVFAALFVFVPLNLGALALLPERGVFNHHGAQRLAVLATEAALTAGVILAQADAFLDWISEPVFGPELAQATPLPHLGIALLGAAVVATVGGAILRRSAIEEALTGALVAFAIAGHRVGAPEFYSTFVAAAGLIITFGVLQDTFRMAFRDELTALPSRRALNERLMGLGGQYTIAMVDVDHFKSFNDTFGHEIGDQVLKMVAAKLAEVTGGGRAYRYGGEEFTVLFPGKRAAQTIPHLEALRENIEAYHLALRGADRPRRPKGSKRQRGGWRGRDTVSVTVSVGVAECSERLATPEAVIEAADRALYRAKERGRNRVSR